MKSKILKAGGDIATKQLCVLKVGGYIFGSLTQQCRNIPMVSLHYATNRKSTVIFWKKKGVNRDMVEISLIACYQI